MKKFLLVLMALVLVTGCGKKDEEKEAMLYNSLESAYRAIYASDGVGLAVLGDEKISIDEKTWYLVASSEYKTVDKLTSLADNVYTKELAKEINDKIKSKYREVDTELYTLSEGGCKLPYQDQIDTTLREDIKKDIKIKKIKSKTITFEFQGKEYEAELNDDHYVFNKKIFTCVEN